MKNDNILQEFCNQEESNSSYGIEMSEKEFVYGMLSDFSLEASNLQNSRFEKCIYNRVNFYDNQMSMAIFQQCIFTDCDFSSSKVYKTEFQDCIFVNSKFIKWNLLSTVLDGCTFVNCDFKLADFGSAAINNSRIVQAKNLDAELLEGILIQ